MPRGLGWFYGGGRLLLREVPLLVSPVYPGPRDQVSSITPSQVLPPGGLNLDFTLGGCAVSGCRFVVTAAENKKEGRYKVCKRFNLPRLKYAR